MKLAYHDAQVRRFMTVPGVGLITALAFQATIDEPPASPYAIMRSVHPYRGENSGPGTDGRWRA
jgi:transposase